MTNEHDDTPRQTSAELLLAEAETLIWTLLDDHLEEPDATRLCKLIEEDAAVRARYVECVQLHVDLVEHYASNAAESAGGKVASGQVLPTLWPGGMPGAESFQHLPD